MRNLISVIGDKEIADISREDALTFREWWLDRVRRDGIEVGTANKDIGHLNGMLNDIDDLHRLNLGRVFDRMRLRGEKTNQAPSFTTEWVRDKLLAPGALAGLNKEARIVVLIMCNTGMRPSEIVNLSKERLRLGSNVPHVEIAAEDRQMKTDHSARTMPLVGISLEGARQAPQGFAKYRGNGDTLSATVNKFLTENNLKQTPKHTLYSLRHNFQDRLIKVEAPERIQAELMGHKFHRPKYGKGPSLEQKAEWLDKIAL